MTIGHIGGWARPLPYEPPSPDERARRTHSTTGWWDYSTNYQQVSHNVCSEFTAPKGWVSTWMSGGECSKLAGWLGRSLVPYL